MEALHPPPPRPRVAVIDPCALTRETFQLGYPALALAGGFAGLDELLASGLDADLVITELSLGRPGESSPLQGPPAIRALVGHGYRVCVHTVERRPLVLAQCLSAGAIGLTWKGDPTASSQRHFLDTAAGRSATSTAMTAAQQLLLRHGAVPRLTRRQLQVLHARARGEAWRVLADRLGISAKTAYDRLEAVMAKLAWHLRFIGLDDHSSPADIEHALGLAPGDLMSLDTYLHSVDRPQPLFSAQAG